VVVRGGLHSPPQLLHTQSSPPPNVSRRAPHPLLPATAIPAMAFAHPNPSGVGTSLGRRSAARTARWAATIQ